VSWQSFYDSPLVLLQVLTAAGALCALCMAGVSLWRTGRLLRRLGRLALPKSSKAADSDLPAVLLRLQESLDHALGVQERAASERDDLQRRMSRCLQRVGVVRYNAFDDTGSDQSFSVALLDTDGNGIVLTSLFGRSESRVYAKPVSRAASSYALSDEEREAIRRARSATRTGDPPH